MGWFVIGTEGRTGPYSDEMIVQLRREGRLDRASRLDRGDGTEIRIEESPFATFLAAPAPSPGAATSTKDNASPQKAKSVSAAWLFVVLGLGVGAYWLGVRDTTPVTGSEAEAVQTNEKEEERGARAIAQQFVEAQLKAPGTAKYGSREVQRLAPGRYRVSGWVDAQNSFGAAVRNRFSVTVEKTGEKTWKPVEGPTLAAWP